MKIEVIEIAGHKIIKGTYLKSDILDVIQAAEAISKKVNPSAPNGEKRTDEVLLIKNVGGLLSERFVSDILKSYSSKMENIEIIGSNWKALQSSLYQVDHAIAIKNGDKSIKKSIETRSSFSYRTVCPERVITAAFSIIGPYITQNKGQEIHKDFYAFVFFCIDPENLLKDLEKGSVSVYFAGGADIVLLLSFNQESNLDQSGAKYRIIKPITKALDASKFLQKLFL
jgi:hypothetical protein